MSGGYAELQRAIEEIDNPCSTHGYRTTLAESLREVDDALEEAEGYVQTCHAEAENAVSYADNAIDILERAKLSFQRIEEQLRDLQGATIEQIDPLRSLGAVIMAVVGMQCATRVMAERERWS